MAREADVVGARCADGCGDSVMKGGPCVCGEAELEERIGDSERSGDEGGG